MSDRESFLRQREGERERDGMPESRVCSHDVWVLVCR